jgi:hypothetical protein
VAFSPDGTRIVTVGGEYPKVGEAKVWDARTGTSQLELKGHTDLVRGVAFSPAGTRIVTGSYDMTAKVWDARTGTALLTLKGHTNVVTSVAFSPDGTRIVTASDDETAKVWDARTGTPLLTLKGHTHPVRSVVFSADGMRIVTGGGTYGKPGEVKVWEGRPSKELPDEEEIAYRLFHTQPNFGRYREGFQAARVAQDDFAARFYLNLLPAPEQKRLKARAAAEHEMTIAKADLDQVRRYQQQRNWAAAKKLLLERQPHYLAAIKADPKNPNYRQFYHEHLAALTAVHAGLLEQQDAIRTAETCRDLGWNASLDAYNAGCLLSLCIPIVAKHEKLDANQRKVASQFYGDQAMKLLRAAVNKGFKDAKHMKMDNDLNPLRQREDFKKLIAELEGKGK